MIFFYQSTSFTKFDVHQDMIICYYINYIDIYKHYTNKRKRYSIKKHDFIENDYEKTINVQSNKYSYHMC